MRDRLFFPLLGLIAAGMVALALVWPQGAGQPSPPPFGHPMANLPANPPPSPPGPTSRPPDAPDLAHTEAK